MQIRDLPYHRIHARSLDLGGTLIMYPYYLPEEHYIL